MNIQSWGLAWFQQQREQYVSESVTIIHSGGSTPVVASVIEPDTELSRDGVRIRSDKTLFIIKTSLLADIKVQLGTKVYRNGDTYEVVRDKGKPHYFNDPNKLDTVIPTRLLCS
jgi:hypothetical protein